MVGRADFDFVFSKLPMRTQNHNASFVPLSDREAGRNAPLKRQANFPYIGFVGLVGSALTVLASWAILFALNHREVLAIDFLTPASWLSAILSANNILLHLALTEGVNVAWWYRATTKQAPAAELHDTWTYGTSLSSAVLSGKKLNYVALATIAVATIPLNGFLLQNAIAQVPSTKTINKRITIPLMKALPLGYSATTNPDDSLGMLGRDWSGTVWSWMNLQGARTALSADFGGDVDAECLHTCQTFVPVPDSKQRVPDQLCHTICCQIALHPMTLPRMPRFFLPQLLGSHLILIRSILICCGRKVTAVRGCTRSETAL
jgi:hypothetical protein